MRLAEGCELSGMSYARATEKCIALSLSHYTSHAYDNPDNSRGVIHRGRSLAVTASSVGRRGGGDTFMWNSPAAPNNTHHVAAEDFTGRHGAEG